MYTIFIKKIQKFEILVSLASRNVLLFLAANFDDRVAQKASHYQIINKCVKY